MFCTLLYIVCNVDHAKEVFCMYIFIYIEPCLGDLTVFVWYIFISSAIWTF